MKQLKFAAAALAIAASSTAFAQSAPAPGQKPEDLIKARQGLMRLQLMNRGAINGVVKDNAPVTDAVVQNAANLAALAKMLPMVFQKDSGMDKNPGLTKAKPDIWTKEAEFKDLVAKLQTETGKLSEVVRKKDGKALPDQLKLVADTCNSCHDKFRDDPKK